MANKQKQEAALTALVNSNSLAEAAEKAGIDRRTLYNYMHHDADFARAYCEILDRQAVTRMDELFENRQRASAVIMKLLEDEKQPAAIRLKAAQTILQSAAEQEKTVAAITKENIDVNKGFTDFSLR